MENTKEDLQWAKDFVKYAYEHTDDYVCWTYVECLKKYIKDREEQESNSCSCV